MAVMPDVLHPAVVESLQHLASWPKDRQRDALLGRVSQAIDDAYAHLAYVLGFEQDIYSDEARAAVGGLLRLTTEQVIRG